MANLIFNWFSFILFVSAYQDLTQLQYFLCGNCMLCLTCLYNLICFVKIKPKVIFFFFTLPSIIFCYIVFVYNDFLSLAPMKYEVWISLLILYLYILVSVICTNEVNMYSLIAKIKRFLNEYCRSCSDVSYSTN